MTILFTADLITTDHNEPRIHDLRLGEALGLSQPRNIRAVINANKAELKRYGEICTHRVQIPESAGRPGNEYYLNEGQALLICLFSRTENAASVRQTLIELFQLWRGSQGAAPLLPSSQPVSPFNEKGRQNMQELFKYLDQIDSHLQDISAASETILLISRTPDISGHPEERVLCFLHNAITSHITTARESVRGALKRG